MMAGIYPFPINYESQSCQFACVTVRIIHFLLIGYLIFYILNEFFSTIRSNMIELTSNASDLKQLNTKLKQKIEENKNMQQEILSAIVKTEEKERKRIASDLHDGLGPVLSAINLCFQAYVDAPHKKEKQNIETRLKDIIDGAITETSRISHNISPLILEKHGIEIAVKHFMTKRGLNWQVVLLAATWKAVNNWVSSFPITTSGKAPSSLKTNRDLTSITKTPNRTQVLFP